MCQRMATRVIGGSLVGGRCSILDRYRRSRDRCCRFLLALLGPHLRADDPADPAARRAADRQGRRAGRSSLRVLVTLLPQALSITIPMALLLGILDRPRAGCRPTASSWRCRPAASASSACSARSRSSRVVGTRRHRLRDRSSRCRTPTRRSARSRFDVVASRAESDVKPRVFFDDFPNRVLYVRDIAAGRRLARRLPRRRDAARSRRRCTSRSEGGIGRSTATKQHRASSCSTNGTQHTTLADKPDDYDGSAFETHRARHSTRDRLPAHADRQGRQRDDDRRAARRPPPRTRRTSDRRRQPALHDPAEVLAAGRVPRPRADRRSRSASATARTASSPASRSASASIFVYYVLLCTSRAARARRAASSPASRRGSPNLVLGVAGVALLIWRAGSADQPIRISMPAFWRRRRDAAPPSGGAAPRRARRAASWSSCASRTSTCRGRSCSTSTSRAVSARLRARVRRAARHLLHLDVHRPGRQAVSRRRRRRRCCCATSISQTPQYRLLHHPDGGAGRDARDDRRC